MVMQQELKNGDIMKKHFLYFLIFLPIASIGWFYLPFWTKAEGVMIFIIPILWVSLMTFFFLLKIKMPLIEFSIFSVFGSWITVSLWSGIMGWLHQVPPEAVAEGTGVIAFAVLTFDLAGFAIGILLYKLIKIMLNH